MQEPHDSDSLIQSLSCYPILFTTVRASTWKNSNPIITKVTDATLTDPVRIRLLIAALLGTYPNIGGKREPYQDLGVGGRPGEIML